MVMDQKGKQMNLITYEKTLNISPESLTVGDALRTSELVVQASSTNTASVFIGNSTGQFFELTPGQTFSMGDLGTDRELVINTDAVFVRGVAGDKVAVMGAF